MVKSSVEIENNALDVASQKIDSIQGSAKEIDGAVVSLKKVLENEELPNETKTESQVVFETIVGNTNKIINDSEAMRREFLLVRAENEKTLGMGKFLDYLVWNLWTHSATSSERLGGSPPEMARATSIAT